MRHARTGKDLKPSESSRHHLQLEAGFRRLSPQRLEQYCLGLVRCFALPMYEQVSPLGPSLGAMSAIPLP